MSRYQETLNRIYSHQWEQNPLTLSHIRLFEEHRYRIGLWFRAGNINYQRDNHHPLNIPGVREEELEPDCHNVRNHLREIGFILKELVIRSVLWAYGEDVGKVPAWALPDPYEPILLMYERGGNIQFYVDHGYKRLIIADNEKGLYLRPEFQPGDDYEPLASLDKAYLDRLDEQGLPENIAHLR